VCKSIVVAARPDGKSDCTRAASAVSSRVVMIPPWTEPIKL